MNLENKGEKVHFARGNKVLFQIPSPFRMMTWQCFY